jgi:hypothetical protein
LTCTQIACSRGHIITSTDDDEDPDDQDVTSFRFHAPTYKKGGSSFVANALVVREFSASRAVYFLSGQVYSAGPGELTVEVDVENHGRRTAM